MTFWTLPLAFLLAAGLYSVLPVRAFLATVMRSFYNSVNYLAVPIPLGNLHAENMNKDIQKTDKVRNFVFCRNKPVLPESPFSLKVSRQFFAQSWHFDHTDFRILNNSCTPFHTV